MHGDPEQVLARTKADGWEGMIAKKSDSRYLPGKRSKAWIKVKNEKDIEVAVIGWEPGQGRREGLIGSLILAVPAGTGWRYVGKVGTGFTDKMLVELAAQLAPLQADSSPVTEAYHPAPISGTPVGCGPNWWVRSCTAKSPGTAPCGIRVGAGCGWTSGSPTWNRCLRNEFGVGGTAINSYLANIGRARVTSIGLFQACAEPISGYPAHRTDQRSDSGQR